MPSLTGCLLLINLMASRSVAGEDVQDGPRSIRIWTRDVSGEELDDMMGRLLLNGLLARVCALFCS